MYSNSNIEVYITLFTLCTFTLKCIQKVHIFVHFLYRTCVAWARCFAIYTVCIHLYTFCIVPVLPTLIWNRNAYKKYKSRRIHMFFAPQFFWIQCDVYILYTKHWLQSAGNIIIVHKNYTKYTFFRLSQSPSLLISGSSSWPQREDFYPLQGAKFTGGIFLP